MGKPPVSGWLRALARGRGGRVAAFGVHGEGGRGHLPKRVRGWDGGRIFLFYSGNYGERRFECQAYGPWGTPMLAFTITTEVNGSSQTTTLTAGVPPWPIVELDSYYPEFNEYDTRAAWFITKTASTRSKVSVSNTVYRSSAVF